MPGGVMEPPGGGGPPGGAPRGLPAPLVTDGEHDAGPAARLRRPPPVLGGEREGLVHEHVLAVLGRGYDLPRVERARRRDQHALAPAEPMLPPAPAPRPGASRHPRAAAKAARLAGPRLVQATRASPVPLPT